MPRRKVQPAPAGSTLLIVAFLSIIIVASIALFPVPEQAPPTAEAVSPTAAAALSTRSNNLAGPEITSFSPNGDGVDDSLYVYAVLDCKNDGTTTRPYPGFAVYTGTCPSSGKKLPIDRYEFEYIANGQRGQDQNFDPRCKNDAKDCKNMELEYKWNGKNSFNGDLATGSYCVVAECRNTYMYGTGAGNLYEYNKGGVQAKMTNLQILKSGPATEIDSGLNYNIIVTPEALFVGQSNEVRIVAGRLASSTVLSWSFKVEGTQLNSNEQIPVYGGSTYYVNLIPSKAGDVKITATFSYNDNNNNPQTAIVVKTIQAVAYPTRSYSAEPVLSTSFAPTPWTQAGGESQAGYTRDIGPAKNQGETWAFTDGGEIITEPLTENGIVFAASKDKVYAINAGTGRKIWSYDLTASKSTWLGLGFARKMKEEMVINQQTEELEKQTLTYTYRTLFVSTESGIIALDTKPGVKAEERLIWTFNPKSKTVDKTSGGTTVLDTTITDAPAIQERWGFTDIYVPTAGGLVKVDELGFPVWFFVNSSTRTPAIDVLQTGNSVKSSIDLYFSSGTNLIKLSDYINGMPIKDTTSENCDGAGTNECANHKAVANNHCAHIKGTLQDGSGRTFDCGYKIKDGSGKCTIKDSKGKEDKSITLTCDWYAATGCGTPCVPGCSGNAWAAGSIYFCRSGTPTVSAKSTSAGITSPIILVGDKLLAVATNKVVAYDKNTLNQSWSADVGSAASLPTIAPDIKEMTLVYVAAQDGIHVLNGKDGAALWTYKVTAPSRPVYSIYPRLIYFTAGKVLYALNATNKKDVLQAKPPKNAEWTIDLTDRINGFQASPVVSGSRLLTAASDGLHAFMMDTEPPVIGTLISGNAEVLLDGNNAVKDMLAYDLNNRYGNFEYKEDGSVGFKPFELGGHVTDNTQLDSAWIESYIIAADLSLTKSDLECSLTPAGPIRSGDTTVKFQCTPKMNEKYTSYKWRLCIKDIVGNTACSPYEGLLTEKAIIADVSPPTCTIGLMTSKVILATHKELIPNTCEKDADGEDITTSVKCQYKDVSGPQTVLEPLPLPPAYELIGEPPAKVVCNDNDKEFGYGVKTMKVEKCTDYDYTTSKCNADWTAYGAAVSDDEAGQNAEYAWRCAGIAAKDSLGNAVDPCYDTTKIAKVYAYRVTATDFKAHSSQTVTYFKLLDETGPESKSIGIDDKTDSCTGADKKAKASVLVTLGKGQSVKIDNTRIAVSNIDTTSKKFELFVNGESAKIDSVAKTFTGKDATVAAVAVNKDGINADVTVTCPVRGTKETVNPAEKVMVITTWGDAKGLGIPDGTNAKLFLQTNNKYAQAATQWTPVDTTFSQPSPSQGTYTLTDVNQLPLHEGDDMAVQAVVPDTDKYTLDGTNSGDYGYSSQFEFRVRDVTVPSVSVTTGRTSTEVARPESFRLTAIATDSSYLGWAVLEISNTTDFKVKEVFMQRPASDPNNAVEMVFEVQFGTPGYWRYVYDKYYDKSKNVFSQTTNLDMYWRLTVNDSWDNKASPSTGKFTITPPCNEVDTQKPLNTKMEQLIVDGMGIDASGNPTTAKIADKGGVVPGASMILRTGWRDQFPDAAKACGQLIDAFVQVNFTDPAQSKTAGFWMGDGRLAEQAKVDYTFTVPQPWEGIPASFDTSLLQNIWTPGKISGGGFGGIGGGVQNMVLVFKSADGTLNLFGTSVSKPKVLPGMTFNWTASARDRSFNQGNAGSMSFKITDAESPVFTAFSATEIIRVGKQGNFSVCAYDWNILPAIIKFRTDETGIMKDKETYNMKINGTGITVIQLPTATDAGVFSTECHDFLWQNASIPSQTNVNWEIIATDAAGNQQKRTGTFKILSEPPAYSETRQIPARPVAGEKVVLGKRWKDDLGMKDATLYVDEATGNYVIRGQMSLNSNPGKMDTNVVGGTMTLSGTDVRSDFTYTIPIGTPPDTVFKWYIVATDLDGQTSATPDPVINIGQDVSPPQWSTLTQSTNRLLPNESITFTSKWSDDILLDSITLSTNDGPNGDWYNMTQSVHGKQSATATFTWGNPRAVPDGTRVSWFITGRDINGNTNTTPVGSWLMADVTPPTLIEQEQATPIPDVGKSNIFTAVFADNVGLSFAMVSTNTTGVWKNDSMLIPMSGKQAIANYTWKGNLPAVTVVGWKMYAYDTSGNIFTTPIVTFAVGATDKEPPKVSGLGTSPAKPGIGDKVVLFANASDNFGLKNATFEIKINDANASYYVVKIAGTSAVPKYIYSAPGLKVGTKVSWRVTVRDGAGLAAVSSYSSYTIGAAPVQVCPSICPQGTTQLTGWSSCLEGEQTRTFYTCGVQTNYRCVLGSESMGCQVSEEMPLIPIAIALGTLATGSVLGGWWLMKNRKATGKKGEAEEEEGPEPAPRPE